MPKHIKVLLDRQVLIAYDADKEVFCFDCASGDRSHPTPPGQYQILRKHPIYRSKKYDVQMDYAMFFSRDGKAIHKSHAVGPISYLKYFNFHWFGSHGCVRLAEGDAKTLFEWTPVGTRVEIAPA